MNEHDEKTECWKFTFSQFKPIRIDFSKIWEISTSKKAKKSWLLKLIAKSKPGIEKIPKTDFNKNEKKIVYLHELYSKTLVWCYNSFPVFSVNNDHGFK